MVLVATWSQETLIDLTEEQIRGAVAELTEENLLEIITGAGYKIDETQERPTREELIEAATELTLEQKEKMKAQGSRATVGAKRTSGEEEVGSGATPSPVKTDKVVEEVHAVEEENDDLDDAPPQAELARKHNLPDDAGFWDLFQAQVMSDIGPFIKVIPAPVKAFLGEQAKNLRPVLVGAMGAAGPMLGALSKVVKLAGRGLIAASERLEEVSEQVKAKHAGEELESVGASTDRVLAANDGDAWWADAGEPEVIEL